MIACLGWAAVQGHQGRHAASGCDTPGGASAGTSIQKGHVSVPMPPAKRTGKCMPAPCVITKQVLVTEAKWPVHGKQGRLCGRTGCAARGNAGHAALQRGHSTASLPACCEMGPTSLCSQHGKFEELATNVAH